MQTKQYSVKVFEAIITNEDEFISFFDKNYVFFTSHLISISGLVSEKITNYLDEKNLKYIVNVELPRSKGRQTAPTYIPENIPEEIEKIKAELPVEEIKLQEPMEEAAMARDNLRVIDTLVRSGQELKIKGDLLLLNRVNSGGSIDIDGNLIITQIVEGSIRCRGNFMMLKASAKANIVFHDVEVDNSYLKERLNRVELKNNEIKITPVLKETSWE